MSFNPDPQKQAVELTFSRKKIEIDHPNILFNNQKHREGGQGGGRPSNVLQDHFSKSSNSGVKIAKRILRRDHR